MKLVSVDELERKQDGKRVKIIAKRFRESGNTDVELNKLQAKKKRSDKKELKFHKAMVQRHRTPTRRIS